MTDNHILIVDDDAEIRLGTSLRLKSMGHVVKTAYDGQDGVEQAIVELPKLIIMDIRMPRLDGLAALAQLRLDVRTSHVPVIMASASPDDQDYSLELGARYFLRKPYNNDDLKAAINSALDA